MQCAIPALCLWLLLLLLNQKINAFIQSHSLLDVYLILFSASPFHLVLSLRYAGETTSIQVADQSCAIMLKSMPSLSLGHGEGDHLISSSSLSVHPLLAQPGGEPGRLFVCCPPDVACPWRGCSFFSPLTVPDIFPVFSEKEALLDL